jgi:hypothetical protein
LVFAVNLWRLLAVADQVDDWMSLRLSVLILKKRRNKDVGYHFQGCVLGMIEGEFAVSVKRGSYVMN